MIAETLLNQFQDQEHGGFYFTANDHESLIQRPKVSADEATPAGNGIAAIALLRLGYLLAEPRFIQAAERTVDYASQQISNSPMAHGSLLHALEEILEPPTTIILRGKKENVLAWQKLCQKAFKPTLATYAIPDNEIDLPESIQNKTGRENQTLAYVCSGLSCSEPITDEKALLELLEKQL